MVQRPTNKFAEWFPLQAAAVRPPFYDPKTKQFTLIDTCYSTHHLQFDNDADETVYFNELIGPIFGWIDTKVYDQTKDEQKALAGAVRCSTPTATAKSPGRGMSRRSRRLALYHGDTAAAAPAARRGAAAPFDPKLDTMVSYSLYSVIPSPVDDPCGASANNIPASWSGCSAATIRRPAARRRSSRCRSPASIRAAWTSTATASSGRRWPPAATWPASTCASARI